MADIAEKLLDTFKTLKGAGEGDNKKKKRGGIAAGVAVVVALMVVAILSFRAWRQGKKLAKLLHEKAVAEEKQIQAIRDAKLAEKQSDSVLPQAVGPTRT